MKAEWICTEKNGEKVLTIGTGYGILNFASKSYDVYDIKNLSCICR